MTKARGQRQEARRSRAKPQAKAARARPSGRAPAAEDFAVVGVGASAGGLEAFTKLLKQLPATTGMAFVLVQHLDPKRESLLSEILSRSTPMPCLEVRAGMPIEPNKVYVIPANAEIRLVDGSFRVGPRRGERGREMPIDKFLRSLAEQYSRRAIGVVLSGSLSDGALGLRAIKAEGGLTFAQDEGSARFFDMPRAAIAAGAVDFVLPPEKIARELAQMSRHPYIRLARPAAALARAPVEDRDHQRILRILRTTTGVDFSNYRQTTVKRRIARRMALRKADSLKKYYELLRKEPAEVHALREDILIRVTAFFRDPEVFNSLNSLVFPTLLKDRAANTPIRVWIPGCSTGEEVYSIAICLVESLPDPEHPPPIQIFGTDVSEAAIDKARAGIYLDSAMSEVSRERVRRFFVKNDGGWQISRSIRDLCIFAIQNLTCDPPFSNVDLISCRNLLIYLEPVLQKRVVPLMHYALRPQGFLMLGNAETISGFADLFTPRDRSHRIFTKKPGPGRELAGFGWRSAVGPTSAVEPHEARARPTALDLQKEADRLVMGRYAPSGVVINDELEILQFRGRTSPYLEVASGAPSHNLLKMAREGLLVALRASIVKARKTRRPARTEGLHVRQDGHFRRVNLEVIPIDPAGGGAHSFLVLFEDAERKGKHARATSPDRRPKSGGRSGPEKVVELEQELGATKEYLQAIIEEQEASNEELKSANEEILSANEELQSTNEELETAKEELQSTNEELTTVNDELQNRNVELVRLNDDLRNIFTGTSLAIVLLDADGRLRRFTPQAEKLLNLVPADVGRPIREVKPTISFADLGAAVNEIIDTVSARELEVRDDQGRWYLMRGRPYRTVDNRIDGAILAFFDIDLLKRSLDQVNRARDYSEAIVETVREALVVLDDGLRVRTANRAFYRTFQTSPARIEGKDFLELWGLEARDPSLREALRNVAAEAPLQDHEVDVEIDGLGRKTLVLNARRVQLTGESGLILLAILDVTERKSVEQALRASESRYRHIFETAREGIWLMDAKTGEILDVNPFLEQLLGYRRAELVGRKPWDLGLYEDGEAARARFDANLAGGFGFEQEIALRSKVGQPVFVEALTNTYQLGDRLVTQANLRDVTERAKLQAQLRQVQKLDSIGRLAGGVAHDFNNLLNIISAHASVLGREALPAGKRAEGVRSIEKAVERGTAVVKQLLTFARKSDVSFEPTDANVVVREVASMLRETFPKQVRVSSKLADELPRIHADPNQLHQAILNLAVNARDAMPKGGTLTLGTSVVSGETLRLKFPEASAEHYVELCVADTGGGMDPETRRRLFEPFFSTKGAKGQGLGLAVVYGIVNSHRGWIDLESEPEKGTTFRLYFEVPEKALPPARTFQQSHRREARQHTAPAQPGPANRPTLLLVEDEESLLSPIRELFEEEGFEVLTASDGLEAVQKHAENADRISAVLLDLSLPRLGGWQAFLKMRQRDPSLRCIVASGNIDKEQRAQMAEAGVQATVRKPYRSAEILAIVRRVLENR